MLNDMDVVLQKFNYSGTLQPATADQYMTDIIAPLMSLNIPVILPGIGEGSLVEALRHDGVHVPNVVDVVSCFSDMEYGLTERNNSWVRNGDMLNVKAALGGVLDLHYIMTCVCVALEEFDKDNLQQVESIARALLTITLVNFPSIVHMKRMEWEKFLEHNRTDRNIMEMKLTDIRNEIKKLRIDIAQIARKQASALGRKGWDRFAKAAEKGDGTFRVCKKLMVAATVIRMKRNRLVDYQNMITHVKKVCPWAADNSKENVVLSGVEKDSTNISSASEVDVAGGGVSPMSTSSLSSSSSRYNSEGTIINTATHNNKVKEANAFQLRYHVGILRKHMGDKAVAIHRDEETGLVLYLYTNHTGKSYVNYAVEDMVLLSNDNVAKFISRFRFLNVYSHEIARWYKDPNHKSRRAMREFLTTSVEVIGDDSFTTILQDLFLRHEK